MTLTDFLLARIAEDEDRMSRATWTGSREGDALGFARRLARDCAAKRQIVEQARAWDEYGARQGAQAIGSAVMYLAAVYADHPDYRDEWKP